MGSRKRPKMRLIINQKRKMIMSKANVGMMKFPQRRQKIWNRNTKRGRGVKRAYGEQVYEETEIAESIIEEVKEGHIGCCVRRVTHTWSPRCDSMSGPLPLFVLHRFFPWLSCLSIQSSLDFGLSMPLHPMRFCCL